MTRLSVRRGAIATLTVAVLAAGGCGFDPATVPVPGTGVSGASYALHIQFANALNLPPGAKVIADGVPVGNLTGLHIVDENPSARGYVVADVEVRAAVRLPGDLTAELRQATPLGDVHIALVSTPGSTAAPLAPDATIPLAHTQQAVQVEDTMAGLATALGSGAVSSIQNTMRQINSALPPDPRETARIFGVLGADLTDVAGDLGTLDQLLNGLNAVETSVGDYLPTLQRMLTDDGTAHVVAATQSVIGVLFIFTNMAPVAHSAVWLAPLVAATDAAARAYVPMLFGQRPLNLDEPSNLKMLVDLVQNKLIPFAEHGPKVNLTGVSVTEAGSPADRTDRVIGTLRMIGAVR
ncbi:MlaD family protein [Nocardia sp. CA-136227]|uniref:MlaD family protein n=1 Tax=Nocardia sp. CA-136227 TaxID=3239979 RepID=UPI003D965A08